MRRKMGRGSKRRRRRKTMRRKNRRTSIDLRDV